MSGERVPLRVVVAVMMLGFGLLAGQQALAQDVYAEARLPVPLAYTSAIWDGHAAYIFGGRLPDGTPADAIIRYDPATSEALELDVRLPSPLKWTTAVWDGEFAYIFGGFDGTYRDEILRFDPRGPTIETMAARFPTPRDSVAAVWTGQEVLLFGGGTAAGVSADVLSYDPVADEVVRVDAALPEATQLSNQAAIWDGSHAYLFGGYTGTGGTDGLRATILAFDPVTDVITPMVAALPTPRAWLSAIWTGEVGFVFGGGVSPSVDIPLDEVLLFDPEQQDVASAETRLKVPLQGTSAVWTGRRSLVFGGAMGGGAQSDLILASRANGPPAPVISPGPLPPHECSDARAAVTLDGSGSFDPDGDPIASAWLARAADPSEGSESSFVASFPLGTSSASLTVSDGELEGTAHVVVDVQDTIAPVTTPVLDGVEGDTGWWRSPVTVTMGVEEQCGVDSTSFEIDDEGVRAYGGPFEVTGDGAHVVEFWSKDIGGNEEPHRELPIHIDAAPPAVGMFEPDAHCLYVEDTRVACPSALPETIIVGDVSVDAVAEDATSGLARIDFLVDGEVRDSAFASPHTFRWDSSDDTAGEHHIEVCAEDHAGNRACDGMDVTLVPLPDVGPVELGIDMPDTPPLIGFAAGPRA